MTNAIIIAVAIITNVQTACINQGGVVLKLDANTGATNCVGVWEMGQCEQYVLGARAAGEQAWTARLPDNFEFCATNMVKRTTCLTGINAGTNLVAVVDERVK